MEMIGMNNMEQKEEYMIITEFNTDRNGFSLGFDIAYYDTLEEALEDYDPVSFQQRLLKVVEIIP